MKVGVLGSGGVAQTLTAGFIRHGHEAMIGTRDKAKLADWLKKNTTVQVGSFSEVAAFGEVVVLAVKGSAAADALRSAGRANLTGKLMMDACNPIADAPPENGVLKVLHDSRQFANGTVAKRLSRGALRQGVQFSGGAANGEPGVQRRPTYYVHLRQR